VGKPNFSGLVVHVGSGAVTIGNFLNAVIEFLIVACVVYFAVVLPMNALLARMKKPEAPAAATTKPCPECLSEIPLAAKRCAHCAQPVA
jgi:large conductance mechanosensitive channel